jgi:hypothetical protein
MEHPQTRRFSSLGKYGKIIEVWKAMESYGTWPIEIDGLAIKNGDFL